MEVLDKVGPQGFLCHKCGYLLEHDVDNNRGGHEQSTKLNAQFKFITDLLPEIDKVVIPENTFEQALASARRVVRDATNPAYESAPVDVSTEKPTAVRGLTNVGPTSISVTLTTSEGPTEADLAAAQARREKIAAQNAMPLHFTHSTITGEQIKFTSQPLFQSSQSLEPDKKDISLDSPSASGDTAEIDDYFARLKAEQEKEAAQEQDEEYETDDEDEEDLGFEDVVPNGTNSEAATPASSFGAGDIKPTPTSSGLSGVLKKSGSGSTSPSGTSPVTGLGTPEDRPAKKVRIEEPTPKDEDEESEEDMEFEDV
jgi:transcription initiation factor TFIIE subunit alpha